MRGRHGWRTGAQLAYQIWYLNKRYLSLHVKCGNIIILRASMKISRTYLVLAKYRKFWSKLTLLCACLLLQLCTWLCRLCMHDCVHLYTLVRVDMIVCKVYVHVYVHGRAHLWLCAHVHTCTYIHVHVYVCMVLYMYMHLYPDCVHILGSNEFLRLSMTQEWLSRANPSPGSGSRSRLQVAQQRANCRAS